MDPSSEVRPPLTLEQRLQESTLIAKQQISSIYPFVTFETERKRLRADAESVKLAEDLRQIGLIKSESPADKEQRGKLIQEWQARIQERRERTKFVSLAAADLSNLNLSGIDLSGIVFQLADLSGSNLSGSSLKGSTFMKADFSNSILRGANLEGSLLIEADLSGADLEEVNMGGNFAYSIFTGANVKPTAINQNGFFGVVDFPIPLKPTPVEPPQSSTQSALPKAVEIESLQKTLGDLTKLYREYLDEGHPENDKQGQQLIDELIALGKRKATTKQEEKQLQKDKLEWGYRKNEYGKVIRLDGQDLSNLDLSVLDLTGMSFIGTNFENSDFTWSVLSGNNLALANFRNAVLHMSDFRGSFPIGADFTDADLTAARMRDTIYYRSIFRRSKFGYTDCKRTVLLEADFTEAKVNFEDTTFEGSAHQDLITKPTTLPLAA